MRDRIIALVVILALAAGVGVLIQQKRKSPTATRERMVERFIAILPDSLDDNHILEIRQLFYTLREREKIGKVKPETMAAMGIMPKMKPALSAFSITRSPRFHS